MERHMCCLISKQELLGVYKTVYLFLENQNFRETCSTFQRECDSFGCTIPNITGSVRIVKQPNKTCTTCNNIQSGISLESQSESFMLESTYNENPGASEDQTQVMARIMYSESDSENCNNKMEGSTTVLFSNKNSQQNDLNKMDKSKDILTLKKSFNNLKDEYKKLIEVTATLTNALQNNMLGQKDNLNMVLTRCKSIYPALFIPTSAIMVKNGVGTRDVSDQTDFIEDRNSSAKSNEKSKLEQSLAPKLETVGNNLELRSPLTPNFVNSIVENIVEEATKTPQKNVFERLNSPFFLDLKKYEEDASVFNLDYKRVKNDLRFAKPEVRLALLQALRWRITKTDNKFLKNYIQNDLLNLSSNNNSRIPDVYFKNIKNSSENLVEGFARLLNTFACFTCGRDYLASSKWFIDRLLELKLWDNQDTYSNITRDMLIATMQKISLRKHIRRRMITVGLTEDLMEFLNNYHDKLSDYCLEYSIALLMNLSLEKEARDRMSLQATLLVNLLKKLLTGKACCLPYVNGTLYSVLKNKTINTIARQLNLNKSIELKIQTITDEQLKHQLEIILRSRFVNNYERLGDEGNEEEVCEEFDLLENELDLCDIVVSFMPVGEELLKFYRANDEESDTNSSSRPITPAIMKREYKQQTAREPTTLKLMTSTLNAESKVTSSDRSPLRRFFSTEPMTLKAKAAFPKQSQPSRKTISRFYQNPICYMDAPCMLDKDNESKYSCSCYKTIKAEIEQDAPEVPPFEDLLDGLEKGPNQVKEATYCRSCGENVCKCAFETRPKISRTPPPE